MQSMGSGDSRLQGPAHGPQVTSTQRRINAASVDLHPDAASCQSAKSAPSFCMLGLPIAVACARQNARLQCTCHAQAAAECELLHACTFLMACLQHSTE